MGNLVYEPPRDGSTLWEIGIPDRSAAEFYIPDPNPKYVNRLYLNHPDRLALLHFSLNTWFGLSNFKNKRSTKCSQDCLIIQTKLLLGILFRMDRFRQYGLWERYADLYPDGDLVYTVGESDFRKDWFFAHVNRYKIQQWPDPFRLVYVVISSYGHVGCMLLR